VKSHIHLLPETPELDGEYTVFGEIEHGLDVIDKIASLPGR